MPFLTLFDKMISTIWFEQNFVRKNTEYRVILTERNMFKGLKIKFSFSINFLIIGYTISL